MRRSGFAAKVRDVPQECVSRYRRSDRTVGAAAVLFTTVVPA
jgi:hypothetical protein